MEVRESDGYVYVVLTQSGSMISKGLKLFTKDKYNHVSVSLNQDLSGMCSFGRYYAYFPFYGGFCEESIYKGALKRFKNAQSLILRFKASGEVMEKIKLKVAEMFSSDIKYRYDMVGVFLAAFNKKWKRSHRYYCSSFVKELLIRCGAIKAGECPDIMKPQDFIKLSGAEKIYEGSLHEYVHSFDKCVSPRLKTV